MKVFLWRGANHRLKPFPSGKLEQQLANLNTLVLDESDQLLAAGFLPSIETIIQYIPMTSPDLQTMMFTATVPPSLHEVVSSTLKPDGYFLDADESKTKWGLSQFNIEKVRRRVYGILKLVGRYVPHVT